MFRDYKNYDVLEDGRIWSKVRKKFLKPAITKNGYQRVCLYDNNGKKHWQFVHRVIYEAVTGKPIPKGMQINHRNEFQKHQNAIWNLELVTPKENLNFGTRNARAAKALSKRCAAFKDGELVMVYESTNEARRMGFSQGHVAACCRGERKTHKGYEWRYLEDNE